MTMSSLWGPLIHNVTIRSLLQMRSGLDEYDDMYVRGYQNTHRGEDLTPLWILNTSNRTRTHAQSMD